MLEGASLQAPETVYFSHDTDIGRDVVIEPNVWFGLGTQIGDEATIRAFCHIEGATIGKGAEVGPFARLRRGTNMGPGSKAGNFVEIKNTKVEDGAKINHLSYVGDARVGEKANVGAGTITCNYDGYNKHKTDIGSGVFIGSNTSLIAPVSVGQNANTAAGSVITRDVPAEALAFGRARQENREGLAKKLRARYAAAKSSKNSG